jgi:hypothetical protein
MSTPAAPEPTIAPAFYTVRDMTKLLRRCERWVRSNQARLPGYTRAFGGVRFVRAAVDAYLQALASGNVVTFRR